MGVKAREGSTDLSQKNTVVVGSAIRNNFYNPNQRPGAPMEPPDLMGRTLKVEIVKGPMMVRKRVRPIALRWLAC